MSEPFWVMDMIRVECRARFTEADFDFILSYLAKNPDERQGLQALLSDPESLDLVLDQKELFRTLLEITDFVGISAPFYFYVMVRQALLRAGRDDRDLADYVAALLAEFSSARKMRHPLGDGEPYDYLVDLVRAIEEADDPTRFCLSLHLGNYSLFLAGIFSDYIRYRERRRAAPGLQYYEALGSNYYRIASDHRLARHYAITSVLTTLSDEFHHTREALNDLSDRLICWNEGTLG